MEEGFDRGAIWLFHAIKLKQYKFEYILFKSFVFRCDIYFLCLLEIVFINNNDDDDNDEDNNGNDDNNGNNNNVDDNDYDDDYNNDNVGIIIITTIRPLKWGLCLWKDMHNRNSA